MVSARLDRAAVAAQADERVDWRHKGIAPAFRGMAASELRARRPRLSGLPTPLLTLSRPALDHNRETMARWSATRRIELAPHGKTLVPVIDDADAGDPVVVDLVRTWF